MKTFSRFHEKKSKANEKNMTLVKTGKRENDGKIL